MSFHHEKTAHAARGKWKGILLHLGVPAEALTGKHCPCPMCGGTDRFMWDNKDQRGTYICHQCGAGDGMKFALEFTGRPFNDVASQIDGLLGNVKADAPVRPEITTEQAIAACRQLWASTAAIKPGDAAHRYFESRHIGELIYPKALRFGAAVRDGEGGVRPCVVARVVGPDGAGATLHRTFLKPDGSGKAEMQSPRKLMAGELPDGACVQLSDYHGGPLGIAEGIETAMSASALYSMPVWAALTAGALAKWMPPPGCDDVVVFGDNDHSFTGQRAAYTLGQRLKAKGIGADVLIPDERGTDFSDVWTMHRKAMA